MAIEFHGEIAFANAWARKLKEALERIECSAESEPELRPFVEFLQSSSRSLVR